MRGPGNGAFVRAKRALGHACAAAGVPEVGGVSKLVWMAGNRESFSMGRDAGLWCPAGYFSKRLICKHKVGPYAAPFAPVDDTAEPMVF